MEDYNINDTVYALATPFKQAALAVIRISSNPCNKLFEIFDKYITNKEFKNGEGYRIYYSYIIHNDKKIDQVLLAKYTPDLSYTGEDMLEISCHGSLVIIRELLDFLSAIGFRQAYGGEFSFRSFLNNRIELTQAEAINALVNSQTKIDKDNNLNIFEGNLFKRLKNIKDKIKRELASMTVQIDYNEDDISDNNVAFSKEVFKDIEKELNTLVDSYHISQKHKHVESLIIVGRPNSGKSSLFNILLKRQRAIVSDKAGTTTDYLSQELNFFDTDINLIDTAGIRDADNYIEKEGIKRTYSLIDEANIILFMVDSTVGLSQEDDDLLNYINKQKEKKLVKIWNKVDQENNKEYPGDEFIKASLISTEGLDLIIKEIKEVLEKRKYEIGENDLYIINQRQQRHLKACYEGILRTTKAINEKAPLEFIHLEATEAINSLGKITGEIKADDILSEVFSLFCVGK